MTFPQMTPPPSFGRPQMGIGQPRLARTESAAVLVVANLACALGLLGFVNSFARVQAAARPSFGSLAFTVPLGIDLGIAVFAALDIVLARLDMRLRWLRLIPWALTAATVALNVSGEPSLFGRVAHAVLPALWVVAVEVAAHVVKTLAGIEAGTRMDRVRTSRWFLAPFRTAALWRRMVLWEIRSYPKALKRERDRVLALTELQDEHGPFAWRWKANRRTRALYRLGELVPAEALPEAGHTSDTEADRHADNDTDNDTPKRPARRPAKKRTASGRRADKEAEALKLLTAEPNLSGAELGRRLRVSDRTGRRLHGRVSQRLATENALDLEGATA